MAIKLKVGQFFTRFAFFVTSVFESSQVFASTNGDYVKAASLVQEACNSFAISDFDSASKKVNEANELIDGLLKTYPESEIALKIVTDPNLKIGICKLSYFRNKILPSIKNSANANMKPFDIAWTIAVSSTDEKMLEYFATYLAYSNYQLKDLSKKLDKEIPLDFDRAKMLDEALKNIKSPTARHSVRKAIASSDYLIKTFDLPRVQEKSVQINQKLSFSERDFKDFLKQAAIASYNIDATQKLLNFATKFSFTPEQKKVAEEALIKAFENVRKITVMRMKSKAMANLAKTMLNFDMLEKALFCVPEISNDPKVVDEIISSVASKFIEQSKLDVALTISNDIKSTLQKDEFLLSALKSQVELGKWDEANKILASITSADKKLDAKLFLQGTLFKASKLNLKDVDFEELKTLSPLKLRTFLSEGAIPLFVEPTNLQEEKFVNLLSISKEFGRLDKNLTKKFVEGFAENLHSELKGKKLHAEIAIETINQFLFLGIEDSKIISFLDALLLDFGSDALFYKLTDMGVLAKLLTRDALAEMFFNSASFACQDVKAKDRNPKILYLAWQMQISKFDRSKTAEIIKPYLPSFEN